ncbi:LLM class flavin-dependent oxidoreductase [Salinicoccus sp. ID82-1]|uniref:LLM class flavin-dependent oxidoreductase n=1 Tax=Salinicoccus sp. ID82-1 TaxID=2820269 RepID=UPI001F25F834|nr:LLM class flavin-dependent oxidoreductase [Salinicoccus sp. ID82-1]MCG1010354.1 LLM class flavin-dependent oxidoreductase [Salinicoccus sp. ID82-1]
MKLSILDQAPVAEGQTPKEALEASMKLAQTGDAYGYTRFWAAEHHAWSSLASSSPEVFLGYIGAHTSRIRIGSGAVLLPYYKPYKVAENFNMLATLFGDRVDIGIGRAPGGSAEASEALSDGFLQQVFRMPELVDELVGYVENTDARVAAHPLPLYSPEIWMLGTSRKSAAFAAEKGLLYCFGQFMSDEDGAEILDAYREQYIPRQDSRPYTIMGVSVVCARTTEAAHDIAMSWLIWQVQQSHGGDGAIPSIEAAKAYELTAEDEKKLQSMKEKMIIGNPEEVADALRVIQDRTGADEFMIITITFSPEDKRKSYQYIAQALNE